MGVLSSSSSSSLAWKMSIEYAYMYICCPQRKCIVFAFFFKKKKVECADPRTCILLLPESGAAGGGRQAGRQTALGVRYTSTIFLPGKKAAETQSIDRSIRTHLALPFFFFFQFPVRRRRRAAAQHKKRVEGKLVHPSCRRSGSEPAFTTPLV